MGRRTTNSNSSESESIHRRVQLPLHQPTFPQPPQGPCYDTLPLYRPKLDEQINFIASKIVFSQNL